MRKILLVTLCFLGVQLVFSQYKYPQTELANEVLKNKLAVQLLPEKSEDAKIANEAMKSIFKDNWKGEEVVFLTADEIDNLKNNKSIGYSFLTQADALKREVRSGYINPGGGIQTVGVGSAGSTKFNYSAFTFSYYDVVLETISEGKVKTVTSIGMANGELTKIDYLFICQQLNLLLDASSKGVASDKFYDREKNIEKVKSKTFVLLEDFFKEKDRKKISKYYTYPHELSSREGYESTILNKTKEKTYVKIIWSHHKSLYMWAVVEADTGAIISQIGFGGIHFGRHHDANDIIKVKHLKYAPSALAQKVNCKY